MSDTPPNSPPTLSTPPEPQTFSREYVHELREENKTWRQKAQAETTAREVAEKRATDAETVAQEAAEKRAKDAETAAEQRVKEADRRANTRIINAELRLAAAKAGIIDLDGLKLLDVSKVTIKDDGTVAGADELIGQAKKDKPYLFGASSTSSTATPPRRTTTTQSKSALEMTDEEWKAERARIKRGGKV
jgi:hypothetical protein